MISNAVGSERVSRVVGYVVQKGSEVLNTPNLPQRIALFGQASTLNQPGLTNDPQQITSAAQAGNLYGFGSMIHLLARILFPPTGGGLVGGIPVWVYPQLAPAGGVAQIDDIAAVGNATGNGVITVRINGRTNLDGASYQVGIAENDTPTIIHQKIADVINNALSAPVTAVATATECRLTAKWVGASSAGLEVEVESEDFVGVAYSVTENQAGAGASTAEITSSLALFGNAWNTIVINPYGSSENATFEAFNGVPDPVNPTGRYAGIVFKPFVALVGKLESVNGANEITDLADDQVTAVNCPAPNSKGWAFEAAANVAAILSRQAQDNPHLDTAGQQYPDMPAPADGKIGIYTDYNDRDILVKGGASTVDLINGRYEIQDLVTGYRPAGEVPPSFRFVRSLMQDWNVRYGWFIIEQTNLIDRGIAESTQAVRVGQVIKPKDVRQLIADYAEDLAGRNLTVEPAFMVGSADVEIDGTNPDRINIFWRYKRSGYSRIVSTTAEANFAFGLQ